jgi:alpha-tubulin suppressor-like RCC1 family protein
LWLAPQETTGLLVDYRVAVEPRKVTNSKRFKNVAIGPNWTLAVSDTNDLYAWGKNYMGKDSSSLEPVHIAPGLKVKSVASGYKHSAAIGVDGLVYTWGYGGSWFRGGGQLGKLELHLILICVEYKSMTAE